jgi:hypothetical protein
MTLADLDAEIARMDTLLRRMKQDAIDELLEELALERNPRMRELFEGQLAKVQAIRPDL